MLAKGKRRKLVAKNMKGIIPKEIDGSGESDTGETTIDSVNNEHVNCSIAINEDLDENQEVTDLLIENNNNGVTPSVPTKWNEENTQENLIQKNLRKINQNMLPLSYLILSMMIILNINIVLMTY